MFAAARAVLIGVLATLTLPAWRETRADTVGIVGSVVYVDDGDTIDVRIGDRLERVRYIGVDAPEVAHEASTGRPRRVGTPGGIEALRVNAALVGGRTVRLELDVEARDRYGRLLAYVWIGDLMVNAELLTRGYARALPIPPNLRHAPHFTLLESQAKIARRGLWSRTNVWGFRDSPRATEIAVRARKAKPPSEVLHVASRARVGLVAHVRARLPERHRARVRVLREHRDALHAARAEAALGFRDERARDTATAPLR